MMKIGRSSLAAMIALLLLGSGIGYVSGWYSAGVWAPVTSFGIDGSGNLDVNGIESNTLRVDALTSGRIPIAGTAGLLGDDADLSFTGGNTLKPTRLNTTQIVDTGLTSGRIPITGTGGLLGDDTDLRFVGGDTLTVTNVSTSDLYVNNDVFFQGTNRTAVLAYPEQAESYIINVSGGIYYSKSGNTGQVTSNANMATLINADITALSSTGGLIFIKVGNYLLTSKININQRNIVIQGEVSAVDGMEVKATRIYTSSGINLIEINEKYCGVKDLWIDGNAFGLIGLYVTNSMASVENVMISGCLQQGFYATAGANDSYYSNIFSEFNTLENIYLVGGYNTLLIHCTGWDSSTKSGIRWDGPLWMGTIIDCRAGENEQNGFYFYNVGNDGQNSITLSNSWTYRNKQYGIMLIKSKYVIMNGNHLEDDSQESDHGYDGIMMQTSGGVTSSYNIVTNNIIRSTGLVANSLGYGIREMAATDDYNLITNNQISGTDNVAILQNGVHSKVNNNLGYITENSGTFSIALHSTTATITHGLSYTPAATDITITWTTVGGLLNCTSWSVTGIGAATFTVNLYDANGAAKGPSGTVTGSWAARRTP